MTTAALTSLDRRTTLPGGVGIPQVGLGVFQVPTAQAQRVVEEALEVGYRHVDTAAAYVNEEGVGAALGSAGLPREEVFVTSKLRNGDQGYERALRAYDDTLARLGLETLDLYLIHWPNPAAGLWQESWRALERILDEGRVRAIGVSNFMVEHLRELLGRAEHVPAVNQIEIHPSFAQPDLADFCAEHAITVQAYSPLGQGADLSAPTVTAIADRLGVTAAQVVLRWHLDQGRVVIPKTTSRARMVSNADLDGTDLTADDLAGLDALETGVRIGNDPRTFALSQIR
ncbi:aldo/keto reductase [Occultella aeris]|uniref:Putative oxidoreductase/MSMEI_2347 n=1 Tax=Occultella aeris TaxID=2761496 RepID=A0A7M4DGY1_9MICO|nr:aldo/keto reductase [Occultella aeris]VZO36174.1 putative oxidoreductase/MSMEI_2347 [Occultella aeris]